LCDDPTGNLDSATTDTILALLAELHREGVTIVVITYEDQVAARAQRVLTMRDGLLTETVSTA
jgi:putative ABC transport system ATP-binding protein